MDLDTDEPNGGTTRRDAGASGQCGEPNRCARRARALVAIAVVALALAGCGRGGAVAGSVGGRTRIAAVGAESQYANLIAQIGGRYVSVAAIMNNPNADPHAFEASPSVAAAVGAARLVVQNGLGYDAFMNRIESASPSGARRVIDVQRLLRLPDSTRNPHLWYDVKAMQKTGSAIARDLSAAAPAHAAYFAANLRRFDRSLSAVFRAIAAFKARHAGVAVATTEPVADYLLGPIGARDMTPWSLQADIMNGVDPAPQDINLEDGLLRAHRVRVFIYNRQVTDTITQAFAKLADAHHVPVVGVDETMPSGYSYQSWMLAELRALQLAVTAGVSTRELR